MTFPTTPVLDNFNRADGSLGANWVNPTGGCYHGELAIISSQCAQAGDTGYGTMSAYNTSFGPDCEFYVTATAVTAGVSQIQLYIRSSANLDGSCSGNGYDLKVSFWNTGSNNELLLRRLSDYAVLGAYHAVPVAGDSFGIQAIGNAIKVFYKPSAGSWSEVISATDSTTTGAGYSGLMLNDTSLRLDNFGGGTLAAAPTADFSGTPLAGGAPLSVAFTDASTGSPTSWLWDFGDSISSTDQNPTHVYTSDGVYTVALTATNDDGDDTETKVDYVTVASPVADFSGTPTSGTVALSVDFTDLSTNAPTSWFWDFGDGGSSTSQNPTYVYNYIGTYTVTLTASNGSGNDSETKVAYITVTAVVEYGAAVIENCDIDTGGAAVGMRVADVAIARDNRFGSVTVDASAELRAKDNSYTTLVNNGTLQPLAGDRSVFDAIGYAARHTNDADDSVTAIHHTLGTGADQAAAGDHAHAGMGTVTSIATGTGLTGGPITTTGTISDANTGVAAATYGDASNIPQIAVNAQGRITAASNIAISVFTPINVYNETQSSDGVSLTYYLINYAAPSTIRVYIDGIRQPASDDVAPTDIVTFSVAPDLGAVLLFDYEMDIT